MADVGIVYNRTVKDLSELLPVTPKSLINAALCPVCTARIDLSRTPVQCSGCARIYPRLGSIPVLLADPDAFLASCRRQMALLEEQADRTVGLIEEEMRAPDVLAMTKDRCRSMIDTIRGQASDIRALVEPLLPGDASMGPPDPPAEDVPAPFEYLHNLYRDWGWPAEPDGENERMLASVDKVLDGQPLERTLVLGTGACRLAYDLHRRDPTAETIVVDIDPVLFAAAHRVIRGGRVSIREANSEIDEVGHVGKEWELMARDGPVDGDRFHFILADGLEPPLAPDSFDTVVTPWFIDLVPDDLRDMLSTIHRLLRPKGRWLNLGPLRYTPDTPVAHRFTREEIFTLAERAGFRMGKWQVESVPYLVSKLNGRGKIESVLAFGATKPGTPPNDIVTETDPPAWLMFHHLPVPARTARTLPQQKTPLTEIVVPRDRRDPQPQQSGRTGGDTSRRLRPFHDPDPRSGPPLPRRPT